MSGALAVRYADGSMVTYRTDAELVQAIFRIDREMDAINSIRRPSRFVFSTSKGL